jgi:hypothetical protein
MSSPNGLGDMLSRSGHFIEPMSFAAPNDRDPHRALRRYRHFLARRISPRGVIGEMRSQLSACGDAGIYLDGWNSWHHDLDLITALRGKTELESPSLWTRQNLRRLGVLSGFRYLFAADGEPVDHYLFRLRRLLRLAIRTSGELMGVPFEVALHPAVSQPLRRFTIYRRQRVTEYRAWRLLARDDIFAAARRDGPFWVFDR